MEMDIKPIGLDMMEMIILFIDLKLLIILLTFKTQLYVLFIRICSFNC